MLKYHLLMKIGVDERGGEHPPRLVVKRKFLQQLHGTHKKYRNKGMRNVKGLKSRRIFFLLKFLSRWKRNVLRVESKSPNLTGRAPQWSR